MQILSEVSKDEFKSFLYDQIDLTDKNIYNELNERQDFIFQCSGNTFASMIRQSPISSFDDIISETCLSRPGAGFQFEDYIRNKETGGSKYPKFIADFLTKTHGCILTQEEIMFIFGALGADANYCRSLLKKLGKASKKQEDLDAWDALVAQVKPKMKENGMTESQIQMVLDDMVKLSAYSFNASHAAAYSYVGAQTAYLATYFKSAFYAANLTNEAGKKDALQEAIKSVSKSGFETLPPNVNESMASFTPIGNNLAFGLGDIKGVGEEPVKNIIENRPYSSIIDFITKTLNTKINKRVTMALIGSGAFDDLVGEDNRKKYFDITAEFYEKKKTKKNPEILLELWQEIEEKHCDDPITDAASFIEMEKTYLGGNFFHGAFDKKIKAKIEKLVSINRCVRTFQEVRQTNAPSVNICVRALSYRTHMQKNGLEMLFFECEDMNGEKLSLPIFGNYWETVKKVFYGNDCFYFIKCYYNDVSDQIMFGSKKFIKDPSEIRKMMIRWIPNV